MLSQNRVTVGSKKTTTLARRLLVERIAAMRRMIIRARQRKIGALKSNVDDDAAGRNPIQRRMTSIRMGHRKYAVSLLQLRKSARKSRRLTKSNRYSTQNLLLGKLQQKNP
ncbi:universal stress protein [Histoplasma capsulatum var. duboisii H88]|uniref:Universal stress protein n=1 Tax=Ajellomyces capsulatus (strain H88) TaxID=544711 RepID=A0A8A1LWJ3_AJEC8|nr:universal stress protein [Histoplasma capsulatum var. duboisii H88]